MEKNTIHPLQKSFFLKQYELASKADPTGAFKKTLEEILKQFEDIQENASVKGEALLAGRQIDSHDIMIAAQEASLAFELMLEVRNKLVEAYQELMRMQF
jgi:flagellar hook-basal body complex protein FliE